MNCKLFNCHKNTTQGYPCCSMTHGVQFREAIETAHAVRRQDETAEKGYLWLSLPEEAKTYYLTLANNHVTPTKRAFIG